MVNVESQKWNFRIDPGPVSGGSERFCGWCDCCGPRGRSVVRGVTENERSRRDSISRHIHSPLCLHHRKSSPDCHFHFRTYSRRVYISLSVAFVVAPSWISFVCSGTKFLFVFQSGWAVPPFLFALVGRGNG